MANYWYHHVHLMSPDPVKTAEFYEKMFNAKRGAVRQMPGGRVSVDLDLNGSPVLIGQGAATQAGAATDGLDHWGIRTDNIEEAVANLKAGGVKFRNEIMEIRPGVKIAFFWAPENVLIEILEVKRV